MRSFKFSSFEQFVVLTAILLIGTSYAQARILIDSVKVDEYQKELFEKDLQAKTGLQSLRFNEENELDYNIWEVAKSGSRKLREAIIGAIDDELNIFQIYDYSGTRKIQFAVTDAGVIDVETGITTYKLKFDFADFRSARKFSDTEVLDSFTLAINLFHEIDHKVSYDINNPIPLYKIRPEKSVRQNVNFIRWELGLILRDTKRVLGRKYDRDIYQIAFVNRLGKRKFLRWRITGK